MVRVVCLVGVVRVVRVWCSCGVRVEWCVGHVGQVGRVVWNGGMVSNRDAVGRVGRVMRAVGARGARGARGACAAFVAHCRRLLWGAWACGA